MKYTVLTLSLSGLGNAMFKAGDVVTEANFPSGRTKELVEQGFLAEGAQEAENTSTEPAKEAPKANAKKK